MTQLMCSIRMNLTKVKLAACYLKKIQTSLLLAFGFWSLLAVSWFWCCLVFAPPPNYPSQNSCVRFTLWLTSPCLHRVNSFWPSAIFAHCLQGPRFETTSIPQPRAPHRKSSVLYGGQNNFVPTHHHAMTVSPLHSNNQIFSPSYSELLAYNLCSHLLKTCLFDQCTTKWCVESRFDYTMAIFPSIHEQTRTQITRTTILLSNSNHLPDLTIT